MNSYFSTLDAIVNKRKISNRIRFMIQDVVDLRKTGWKPRREDNNPKTIDQIHREVHKEREEQERELNNLNSRDPWVPWVVFLVTVEWAIDAVVMTVIGNNHVS